MKTGKAICGLVAVVMAGFLSPPVVLGQGLGVSGGTRNTDGLGGGSGIDFGPPKREGLPARPEPKRIQIQLTLVGKPREWTNSDGRKIAASLVAFPKLPGGEKNTPIEILKDGNIRLLPGKPQMINGVEEFVHEQDLRKVALYPIEKLSKEDQEFISNLALNIRLSADAAREKAEMEAAAAEEAKERAAAEKAEAEAKAREIFGPEKKEGER